MTDRIKVTYEASPVHCIDVGNANGERLFRIRPFEGGVTVHFDVDRCVYGLTLIPEDLRDLIAALERLAP